MPTNRAQSELQRQQVSHLCTACRTQPAMSAPRTSTQRSGVTAAIATASIALAGWTVWRLWKNRTEGTSGDQDARAALYSMPAYTAASPSLRRRKVFDAFRPPPSAPTGAGSGARRFTVVAIKELLGGLSNSNYMFEVSDARSSSSGGQPTTVKLLLKICEEENRSGGGVPTSSARDDSQECLSNLVIPRTVPQSLMPIRLESARKIRGQSGECFPLQLQMEPPRPLHRLAAFPSSFISPLSPLAHWCFTSTSTAR